MRCCWRSRCHLLRTASAVRPGSCAATYGQCVPQAFVAESSSWSSASVQPVFVALLPPTLPVALLPPTLPSALSVDCTDSCEQERRSQPCPAGTYGADFARLSSRRSGPTDAALLRSGSPVVIAISIGLDAAS